MSVLIGIIVCLGCIYLSMVIQKQALASYYDLSSIIVVLGGTLGATLMAFKLSYVFRIPQFFLKAMLPVPVKVGDIITTCQRMADKARQFGLPALTSEIPMAFDEFARRGIKLVVSGVDSSVVRSIMEEEIVGMEQRHRAVHQFMDGAAAYFPTFGMLGTVLGIVQAMKNIDDVSALGQALALALMTTLYGVFMANAIFLPVSGQLKNKSAYEGSLRSMFLEGLLAVQAGENSQLVGQRLKASLSEAERRRVEGGKGVSKKKGEKHLEIASYMGALDQEKALALMAEIKQEEQAKRLGQDDVKHMLAQLINDAEDKTIMKDFANEVMKLKNIKKLPKGSKQPKKKAAGKKGTKKVAAKRSAGDDEEE